MAATVNLTFWQPRRPARVTDPATRCRPNRMQTSAILCPPRACLHYQVKTFRLYGKLRKATTEVHNSLPSMETIQTERSLSSFSEKRRMSPDDVNYGEFYRGLSSSLTTPTPSFSSSRPGTVRSCAAFSTRSLHHPSTFFTLTPHTPHSSQSARSAADSTCMTQPLPRLGTGYSSLRPLDTRQSDRGGGSHKSTTVGSKSLTLSSLSSKLTE
ncbi:uncharacterized protein LOC143275370 [Babylonia areolata]|uniref:uncharacterized protein LOC143275370 n=1 Tax=Babylonia areolata TaxID=304850 RepID=UPI003FCFDF64